MVILREITLPVDEQIKLLKAYNRGIITVFEMIYKLIDMLAGPNPDNDKLLKAYDTAVHLADIWTSPINVFVEKGVPANNLVVRLADVKITADSWNIPEQHSDPRINGKIRVVVSQPNYAALQLLQEQATVAKD
jgi:hypothetical protein